MNLSEVSMLLAKAALIDNRTIDPNIVRAWHEAIGHHDAADAMAALYRHRQTSTDWLEPAHINALVPVVRRERMRDGLLDRARRALPPPPAQGPPEWFRERAGLRTPDEHPPNPCPWCKAEAHAPCTVRGSGKPMSGHHPARTAPTEAVSPEAASSLPGTEEEPW